MQKIPPISSLWKQVLTIGIKFIDTLVYFSHYILSEDFTQGKKTT